MMTGVCQLPEIIFHPDMQQEHAVQEKNNLQMCLLMAAYNRDCDTLMGKGGFSVHNWRDSGLSQTK